MHRLIRRSKKRAGSAPGTLVHVGEERTESVALSVIHYDDASLTAQPLARIDDARALLRPGATTWVNIDGIHDVATIEQVGRTFDIHPLTLEDILNTTLRPKVEAFENYLFVVMKIIRYQEDADRIVSEQISLILGKNVLLSFQEVAGDVFDPVRERIRKGGGRIRSTGCDYLAYALIDTLVDNYFLVLDKLGDRLETLEASIDDTPDSATLETIHAIRRELISLRRQVWPLREIISRFTKADLTFISENTALYMRDVYDHTIQTIDTIESFRDTLSGLQDLYLSIISNRMNEVMKVLTIIATIFIPLTFIAGVYGMNFRHMPELEWRWGYAAVWLVMIVAGGLMVLAFRRKKWL